MIPSSSAFIVIFAFSMVTESLPFIALSTESMYIFPPSIIRLSFDFIAAAKFESILRLPFPFIVKLFFTNNVASGSSSPSAYS